MSVTSYMDCYPPFVKLCAPNKPDALSHSGNKHELCALLNKKRKLYNGEGNLQLFLTELKWNLILSLRFHSEMLVLQNGARERNVEKVE